MPHKDLSPVDPVLATLLTIGWVILIVYLIVRGRRGQATVVPMAVPVASYMMHASNFGLALQWWGFLWQQRRKKNIEDFLAEADRLHARSQQDDRVLSIKATSAGEPSRN